MFSKEDEQLMIESRKTLQNLKELSKIKTTTLYESHKMKTYDQGKNFFEEYDDLNWEYKAKIDMLFYEQLLQKLDNEYSEVVNETLSKLYKCINEVYQFINIRPEIYSKNSTKDLLTESNETIHRKLSKVIYEYLDRNYYSLTTNQRKEKYEDIIHEHASYLIKSNVPTETAVKLSAKIAVVEGLIESIAFPFAIKSRLNYLLENEDYKSTFDVEKLEESKSEFDNYRTDISKIIATCI